VFIGFYRCRLSWLSRAAHLCLTCNSVRRKAAKTGNLATNLATAWAQRIGWPLSFSRCQILLATVQGAPASPRRVCRMVLAGEDEIYAGRVSRLAVGHASARYRGGNGLPLGNGVVRYSGDCGQLLPGLSVLRFNLCRILHTFLSPAF